MSSVFWKHFNLHIREGYSWPQKATDCSNSCSHGGDCHMMSIVSRSVWRNKTWRSALEENEGRDKRTRVISNRAVCFLLYFYSATDKLRWTNRCCFLIAGSLLYFWMFVFCLGVILIYIKTIPTLCRLHCFPPFFFFFLPVLLTHDTNTYQTATLISNR